MPRTFVGVYGPVDPEQERKRAPEFERRSRDHSPERWTLREAIMDLALYPAAANWCGSKGGKWSRLLEPVAAIHWTPPEIRKDAEFALLRDDWERGLHRGPRGLPPISFL